MNIKNERQNLEQYYKNFINKDTPLDFFKGLFQYLDYTFSIPILKSVFDEQLSERRVLYKNIENLDHKVNSELEYAKVKLFNLIKITKSDIYSFQRYTTNPLNDKINIIQELEAYENRKVIGSIFKSDEISRYLFDISVNLLKTDKKEELNEFIVSSKEYGEYYGRINDFKEYIYTGNQYGNFIFSKTLPERYENVAHFERERMLKSWGSFELLLQFNKAHEFVLSKKIILRNVENYNLENSSWFGSAKELIRIFSMAKELQDLIENELDFYSQVRDRHDFHKKTEEAKHLKIDFFKKATEIVHNILGKTLSNLEKGVIKKESIGLISKDKEDKKTIKTIKIINEESKGYLLIEDKKIKISNSTNSSIYKFCEILIPLEEKRSIDTVFNAIQTSRTKKVDNFETYNRKEILKQKVKEINRIISNSKSRIKMRFKINFDDNKNVWVN